MASLGALGHLQDAVGWVATHRDAGAGFPRVDQRVKGGMQNLSEKVSFISSV